MTTQTATNTAMTIRQVIELTKKSVNLSMVNSGRIFTDNWQDCKIELSEQDKEDIVNLLGGWERTKVNVRRALDYIGSMRSKWFLERIYFCNISNRWAYCAGQDYTAELALIRKELSNY